MKLPQLQNLVKRDPAAYKEEFTQQLRAYQAEAKVLSCWWLMDVWLVLVCHGLGTIENETLPI